MYNDFSDDDMLMLSNYRLILKQIQCTGTVRVTKYDECLYHIVFVIICCSKIFEIKLKYRGSNNSISLIELISFFVILYISFLKLIFYNN